VSVLRHGGTADPGGRAHVITLGGAHPPVEQPGEADRAPLARRKRYRAGDSAVEHAEAFQPRAFRRLDPAGLALDGQPNLIAAWANPSNSDKTARRNLAHVGVPNPHVLDPCRSPQPFEVRPSTGLPPRAGPGRPEDIRPGHGAHRLQGTGLPTGSLGRRDLRPSESALSKPPADADRFTHDPDARWRRRRPHADLLGPAANWPGC
jgi:hypothetical protein